MSLLKIPNDVTITGTLTVQTALNIPDGTVDDAAVAAGAAIDVTKLDHQHFRGHAQPNTTATTETRTLHVARTAGTLEEFVAGSIAACAGAATVTLDLKKNGSSVLSAAITLDSGNTARVVEAATITTSSYAAGDWFEVVITATAGGGTLGTGVYCQAVFSEGAA